LDELPALVARRRGVTSALEEMAADLHGLVEFVG
jgi:hypothetical protein